MAAHLTLRNWRMESAPTAQAEPSTSFHPYFEDNNHAHDLTHENPVAGDKNYHIRGEKDPRTLKAIKEGRRLYVGNLPYKAQTKDVEELFVKHSYIV